MGKPMRPMPIQPIFWVFFAAIANSCAERLRWVGGVLAQGAVAATSGFNGGLSWDDVAHYGVILRSRRASRHCAGAARRADAHQQESSGMPATDKSPLTNGYQPVT